MKILELHNHYQQPGGEDVAFLEETEMLRERGHRVSTIRVHNQQIENLNRAKVAAATIWNHSVYRKLSRIVQNGSYSICHFHNTFPLISPAAYYAAKARNAAVVQTVHNFRFLCPGATFHRDGQLCHKCAPKLIPWPSIAHGCYRDSRPATACVAAMLTAHKIARTFSRKIDAFIALTEFGRRKMIENGFPPDRVFVKPNFLLDDPGLGDASDEFILYVGRLSSEKGIETLLRALELLKPTARLKVAGDGPLASFLRGRYAHLSNVDWLGQQSQNAVTTLMKRARLLVVPSTCLEAFGRVIVEAFATGLPAVASDQSTLRELVEDGRTGFRFRAGDAEDLAAKIEGFLSLPDRAAAMRKEARGEYKLRFTPEANYVRLMEIFRFAEERARPREVTATRSVLSSLPPTP